MKEEGRRRKEEGGRKKEEGRRRKEEGRRRKGGRKKEEGKTKNEKRRSVGDYFVCDDRNRSLIVRTGKRIAMGVAKPDAV